jgi:hypothetical protein
VSEVKHEIEIKENTSRRMFRAVCSCTWSGNLHTSHALAWRSGSLHLDREAGKIETFAVTYAGANR